MIEIIDSFIQGSDDWQKARIGSIGGSSISAVAAKGRGGESKGRKQLLYDMAGEILSGVKKNGYTNKYMEDGVELEDKARTHYCLQNLCEVRQVALIRDAPHKHCSPDGLVGEDGMIEIKCVIPSTFVAYCDGMSIPTDYRRQVQWSLRRTGRAWCDFVVYCDLLEGRLKGDNMLVYRVPCDQKEMRELEDEADIFIEDLMSLVKKIGG